MNVLRSVGRWLAKAIDVASNLLYEALSASSPEGNTGFDVFGRRLAASVVWLTGALLVTIPNLGGLSQPLGDVLFRAGTTMWAG